MGTEVEIYSAEGRNTAGRATIASAENIRKQSLPSLRRYATDLLPIVYRSNYGPTCSLSICCRHPRVFFSLKAFSNSTFLLRR